MPSCGQHGTGAGWIPAGLPPGKWPTPLPYPQVPYPAWGTIKSIDPTAGNPVIVINPPGGGAPVRIGFPPGLTPGNVYPPLTVGDPIWYIPGMPGIGGGGTAPTPGGLWPGGGYLPGPGYNDPPWYPGAPSGTTNCCGVASGSGSGGAPTNPTPGYETNYIRAVDKVFCDGSGNITYRVQTYSLPVVATHTATECVTCDGSGTCNEAGGGGGTVDTDCCTGIPTTLTVTPTTGTGNCANPASFTVTYDAAKAWPGGGGTGAWTAANVDLFSNGNTRDYVFWGDASNFYIKIERTDCSADDTSTHSWPCGDATCSPFDTGGDTLPTQMDCDCNGDVLGSGEPGGLGYRVTE